MHHGSPQGLAARRALTASAGAAVLGLVPYPHNTGDHVNRLAGSRHRIAQGILPHCPAGPCLSLQKGCHWFDALCKVLSCNGQVIAMCQRKRNPLLVLALLPHLRIYPEDLMPRFTPFASLTHLPATEHAYGVTIKLLSACKRLTLGCQASKPPLAQI
eukprot:scaffold130594_cov18-Tisochrysis_lutea.AAC.2